MSDQSLTLKIGDKDPAGRLVTQIHSRRESYIFYSTHDEFATYIGTPEVTCRLSEIVPTLTRVNALADKVRDGRRIVTYDVVHALTLCAEGNAKSAITILEGAERRLLNLLIISGRLHYLLASIPLIIIAAIVAALLPLLKLDQEVLLISCVVFCGSLGGFLSVSLNLRKLNIDPDAHWGLNAISGCSRILIAMISAVLVYLLIKANIIFGFISQSGSVYAILAISVLAGFSETYIPNILRKIEEEQQGHNLAKTEPNAGVEEGEP